jgi:SAM-dependent methyltransferase
MDVSILSEEAAFADREYAPHAGSLKLCERMIRKYARPRRRSDWREFSALLLGDLADRSLLDFGCGMGEEAICFAKLGARVTAIDASPVGIQITRERAAYNGVSERVTAEVMDATATRFPDNSFDLVHGLGILHHVGLRQGLMETRRLLKPGGVGVFLEPMGNVAFVERCKNWMHGRLVNWRHLVKVNDSEENLRLPDILACADQFSSLRTYPYRLLYRIRKLLFPKVLHPLIERWDYFLLKLAPPLKRLAGAVVIQVRK